MAQTIKIKRSTSVNTPGSALAAGELAYSFGSGGSSGSDKLFIGDASNNYVIGGKTYVDMLDHAAGTLTADSAIIVDSNSKINQLKTANLTLGASSLASSGALTLSGGAINVNGTGTLTITHGGTVDLDAQTNEILIKDNEASALVIKEGTTPYLTFTTTNSGEKIVAGKAIDLDGKELIFDADADTSISSSIDDLIVFKSAGTNWLLASGNVGLTPTGSSAPLGSSGTPWSVLFVDNIKVDGNSITSENTNGDINLTPNGTGSVVLDGINFPQADGSANQFLKTDGNGQLSFANVTTTFTLAADSGSNDSFSTGGTLTLAGGAGITSTVSNDQVSFAVNVDDSTIEINSDSLRVKDSGISTNKIANSAVTVAKLADSAVTIGSTSVTLGATQTTISGLAQVNVDNLRIDGNTISSTNSNGNIVIDPNGTGNISASSARIINVADPVSANDAANKNYVDSVKQALDIKDSVRVASTGNLAVATDLQNGDSVDGVTLATGDRVLLKNQTDASENGIYVAVASGAASRATDADVSADVTSGMFVFVREGTANGANGFVLTTNGTITLGTTDLTFTQFSGAGTVTAGAGLTTGGSNVFSVNAGNTLQTTSDTLNIKGITTTATGDLIIGSGGANGGFTKLAKPAAAGALLNMNTSGVASWSNVIDGGTFT